MENTKNLFKKAYEAGLTNKKANLDVWLEKYGINTIILNKIFNTENLNNIFNRNKEIENIAQFIGTQERQKRFSLINVIGVNGIGKTTLLKLIHGSYAELNPSKKTLFLNADDFSKLDEEDQEEEFYFEKILSNIGDKRVIFIDDCDKDFLHMADNLKALSSYNLTLILAWRPIHWNKFKIENQENIDLDEPIIINSFDNKESLSFIDKVFTLIKKKNSKKLPFSNDALNSLVELSKGIPKIILDVYIKSLKRCFQFNNDTIKPEDVQSVFSEESYNAVTEFLENCTPITKKILRVLVLKSTKQGVSIDAISEEVDLDRTSVFYHLQKMRSVSILNEYYLKKTVMFSIKENFISFVDYYLWEGRKT